MKIPRLLRQPHAATARMPITRALPAALIKHRRSLGWGLAAIVAIAPCSLCAQTTTTYGYDARNRLVSMAQDGQTTTYAYDDAGNRTRVDTSCAGRFNAMATHASGQPLNLRALADSLGYDGSSSPTFTVTVSASITGVAGGGDAIDTGAWPASGACLKLIIDTGVAIRGGGGNGGKGGNSTAVAGAAAGAPGSSGGDAIELHAGLTLVNNGTLHGGSGGGGGGGGYKTLEQTLGGGGGGGGWPNGLGGTGGIAGDGNGAAGSHASVTTAGAGGAGAAVNAGGSGGGFGSQPGFDGQASTAAGGAKGVAGFGIKTNGHLLAYAGTGSNSATGN